jgi:hypothetical protein
VTIEEDKDQLDVQEDDDDLTVSTADDFLSEMKEEVVLQSLLHKQTDS